MTQTLKPCPFCGSRNVDVFSSFGDSSTNGNIINVACISCGAQGAAKLGEIQAVEAWNKRADTHNSMNSELFSLLKNIALCVSYPQFKAIRDTAIDLYKRYTLN